VTEIKPDLNGEALRIGIVRSRFNERIGVAMLEACRKRLAELRVTALTVVSVPGALEAPLAACTRTGGRVLLSGILQSQAADVAAAYAVLTEALAAHPDEPDLLYDLAMVAEKLGRLDEEVRLVEAAGADVTEFTEVDAAPRVTAAFRAAFDALGSIPRPVIAAIEGFALGGGFELALACDLRVAGDGVRFGFPEIQLGIFPGAGGTQRLSRLVGPARAKRITLMCERMDAATALSWGLVDELAEDGKTVEVALAMARKTAEMPPATVRLMKEAINATAGALHRATAFADGDQSQLTGSFEAARAAREQFGKR